jgi:D-alanine-D-alanine ligase
LSSYKNCFLFTFLVIKWGLRYAPVWKTVGYLQRKNTMRTRVAVIFGGRSPEHDVSVKTGLQALHALDQRLYDPFPVYIGLDGVWWIGESLWRDALYIPDPKGLTAVSLAPRPDRKPGGRLAGQRRRGLFAGKAAAEDFDVALLALHGVNGEDGRLQGLLEIHNTPYTGMRTLSSALLMDKGATKQMLKDSGIPLLPYAVIERPDSGLLPDAEGIRAQIAHLSYPLIVKPIHLGSSIGVSPAYALEDLRAALPAIFALDHRAMVEPLVPHLVEYNVAVARFDGVVCTSAIEEPKGAEALLDFKAKYLAGGGGQKGAKEPMISEGMLSLTRTINPSLPTAWRDKIHRWATVCFELTGGAGAPRIDFLCNRQTGEVWLNEVNPCPGSFAYFLWEATDNPIRFPDLLHCLIVEAQKAHGLIELPADPVPEEARLFPRK